MLTIAPIISRIVQEDDAFICYDSDDNIVCLTISKEIANIYFMLPSVLERQAEVIAQLKARIDYVSEEYNNLVMGIIPSGSNLVH